MWVNFLLSAAFMALFVAGMANAVRGRERELAKAREDALKNEQILALGTLSAGVSHEISIPLSTVHLLIDELMAGSHQGASLHRELALMKQQEVGQEDPDHDGTHLVDQALEEGVARGELPACKPLRHHELEKGADDHGPEHGGAEQAAGDGPGREVARAYAGRGQEQARPQRRECREALPRRTLVTGTYLDPPSPAMTSRR